MPKWFLYTIFIFAALKSSRTESAGDFIKEVGKRCAGGSSAPVGSPQYDLEQCFNLCKSRDDCFILNWRSDVGLCVARTVGCQMETDTGTIVYRKTKTARAQPTPILKLGNYELFPSMRCTTGTSVIIAEAKDLNQCMSTCDLQVDCFGVNWQQDSPQCTARSKGCSIEPDAKFTFYRKSSTLAKVSPRQSQEVSQQGVDKDLLSNFNLEKGIRCTGGSSVKIGDIGFNLKECAATCLASYDCAGFNWQEAQSSCVSRTVGCVNSAESASAFYRKKTPEVTTVATTTRVTAPVTTVTLIMTTQKVAPVKQPEITRPQNVLASFIAVTGKGCSGGTSAKIGDTGFSVTQCATLCLANNTCAGFTWEKREGACAAQTVGCQEYDDDFSVFYRNLQALVVQTVPPPAPFVSSGSEIPQPSNGPSWEASVYMPRYVVAGSWECVGNASTQIGLAQKTTMLCAALCEQKPSTCHGFTVYLQRRLCVVRTTDCKLVPSSEGTLIYRPKLNIPSTPSISSASLRTTGTSTKARTTGSFTTTTSTLPSTSTKAPTTPTAPAIWEIQGKTGNFVVRAHTRCIGGTSVRLDNIIYDIYSCELSCINYPSCYGFNADVSAGSCALRTAGCVEEANDNYNFYFKKSTNQITPTISTQGVNSFIISTTAQPSSKPYEEMAEQRCAGGTSVALGRAFGLNSCLTQCLEDEKCYGFNFVEDFNECALRSAGCVMLRNADGVIFYKMLRP